MAKVNPKIGYTTVYRTLKLLTRLGLATQRKFADGETRYERTSEGSHHDHLICLDCGKIIEFEDQTLETLQNRIAQRYQFKPFHHRMELYGLCAHCHSKKKRQGRKTEAMRSCSAETRPPAPVKESIVLIGNPNVGKSVIFNYLTGKYVTVSNYPGTTVEVTRGTLSGGERHPQVVDTPGVNSLIPMSEDEKVTRDILLYETPTHLIQVMDAKNLRRGTLHLPPARGDESSFLCHSQHVG